MAQWYGNVPAVGNVTSTCPPGLTLPEFQTAVFDVVVWAMLSSLVQRTVPPGAIVTGLGTYARDPSDEAPTGIDTVAEMLVAGGVGLGAVGVGVGLVGADEPPPHETRTIVE